MTDKKNKKQIEIDQKIGELTQDLQRTRADFENYRKRVEQEKEVARESGKVSAIFQLFPVFDNIERALGHMPKELEGDKWAQGVAGLQKNLEQLLEKMGVVRIQATPGTLFDPELHEAVQVDEDAVGDTEIVAEELQAGYTLNGRPIRSSIVKVTRQ